MKGKRGPRPQEKEKTPKPNGHAPEAKAYKCDDCTFTTAHLPEMSEHLSGSHHLDYSEVPAEKPGELFTGPRTIKRSLPVPLTPEEKAALHAKLADIATQLVDKEQEIANAKADVKSLEAEQRKSVAELRSPTKTAQVECEWVVSMEENCKRLFRRDTNECIDTRPLSAEDRAEEEKRAAAMNKQQSEQLEATA
jgi:hypothetical protein